jgi:hypothetical protein
MDGKTPRTEDEVVEMIRQRGRVGRAKYRNTMDRVDLPPAAWARHLQEELGDALQYARRVERALVLLSRARTIIESLSGGEQLSPLTLANLSRKWLRDFDREFAP